MFFIYYRSFVSGSTAYAYMSLFHLDWNYSFIFIVPYNILMFTFYCFAVVVVVGAFFLDRSV